MSFNGPAYGAAKKLTESIATGFKTAYSNPDGSYTVEFNDGTKVKTIPIKGDKGNKGDKFNYEDFTPEQLADLKGEQGDKGDRGATGIGIASVVKSGTSGIVDTYTITFTDGAETQYTVVNGANITKLSELENDEEFIKATTINLTNYYLKDETYNKSAIDELLRNVGAGLSVKIVTELPSGESISGTTIYLINTSGSNYNQYMYIDGAWANLGSTAVDMSSYYNKTQIDTKLEDYVTANRLTNKLDDYVQKSNLAKVGKTNSYNDLDDLPEIPNTDGFMKGRQMLGEVDLNDCITEGTFTVATTSAHLPQVNIYGTYADLEVLSIETVVSQQLRVVVGSNKTPMLWSRCRILGTWTEWVYALSNEISTDTVVDNNGLIPTSKAVFDEVKKINDSLVDKVPFKFGITEDGQYGYIKDGADTVTPFKSGVDIQYYRRVATIGPSTPVTTSFSEIGFVPKIVICMNGDSALLRYIDGSFAISIGSGIVSLNNLTTYNIFEVTEEEIKIAIRWHADAMSYNIIYLG